MATAAAAEVDQQAPSRRDPLVAAAYALTGLTVVVLGLSLLVAVALPYGAWDAMAFGTWSRLIAEHWPHLRFSGITAQDYHRPVFYFLQGTVWAILGFHQALGRLLSLGFSVTLVAAVAYVAARTVRSDRRFAGGLAAIVVVLTTSFTLDIVAGLSDIPVAAMVALTAAVLVTPRLGRAQAPLVVVAAAFATLTKPSALPALLGLVLALCLGGRADLRRRAIGAVAVTAGMGIGLAYDGVQASYVHLGLRDFLTTGSDGFYASLADADRKRVMLEGAWLSPELRVLMVFALVYALARLVLAHRRAVAIAFPVALLWSWLGPHLAGDHGVRAGILGTGSWLVQVSVIVLAAFLLLSIDAPPDAIADRLLLARGLVWLAPPLLVWILRVVYDNRLLAPAWPPLVLLIVWALLPAYAGARLRREWLVAVAAAALLVLGAYCTQNINGLGSGGWHALEADGISGLGNAAEMRNIAFGGDFSAEMNALAPQVGPGDRILTFDGRLSFFYQQQVDYRPPLACSQLQGHHVFVLLESDELQTLYGKRSSPAFWESCTAAHLTKVDERPGAYAIFVNGAVASSVGGCGTAAPPGGLLVQFGPTFKTENAARALLRKVAVVGFVQAHVEQLGCAAYRVIESGISSAAVGAGIVTEARTARLAARIVGG
ncbi:MAG TPA: hypothetical protein VGH82_16130 [Gaiellaceae bacterium]|jgi:hypothetical protein